jgi:hypothetical protein
MYVSLKTWEIIALLLTRNNISIMPTKIELARQAQRGKQ